MSVLLALQQFARSGPMARLAGGDAEYKPLAAVATDLAGALRGAAVRLHAEGLRREAALLELGLSDPPG